MKKHTPRRLVALLAAIGATLTVGTAQALEVGGLEIHGYGHQMYLKTTANKFLAADRDGSFRDNILALVLSAGIAERTKLWAQLASVNGESMSAHYFYIDHAVNDDLNVRLGKVLLPIGFYNEIIDARFLQRSGVLPMLYQPATDLVDEAYGGAGVSYGKSLGAGRLTVDGYGGQIVEHASAASGKQKSLVGGRLQYRTPIEGLRVMLSGASKRQQENGATGDVAKKSTLLSLEYRRDHWELKSEIGQIRRSGLGTDQTTRVSYVQAGYDFSDTWSAFVRNDSLQAPGYSASDPATYQKSLGLGVTYKLNSGVSLRVEHHFNKGYGMAVLTDETAAGQGKEKWQMLGASVNFIF
jgi:hypothetical protein